MQIGTKKFSKAKAEEDKETEKKKGIEETNIMMRKKAGKRSQKKESSAPKRRKINKESGYKEQKISSMEDVTENIGEKRKSEVITGVAQAGCGTVQKGHGTSQLTVVGNECDTTQADKDTVDPPKCDTAKTDWATAQENVVAQMGCTRLRKLW